MPDFRLTKTHIIYAAGTITLIVLLIGGSKVLIDHSGSADVKQAVQENKRCQQLKPQGGKLYEECQKELNNLLSKLVTDNELDVNQCKVNPDDKESALCTVTVWYSTKHIVATVPSIVQKVKEAAKGTDPAKQPVARGRRRRGANNLLFRRKREKSLYDQIVDIKKKEAYGSSSSSSSSSSNGSHRKHHHGNQRHVGYVGN